MTSTLIIALGSSDSYTKHRLTSRGPSHPKVLDGLRVIDSSTSMIDVMPSVVGFNDSRRRTVTPNSRKVCYDTSVYCHDCRHGLLHSYKVNVKYASQRL